MGISSAGHAVCSGTAVALGSCGCEGVLDVRHRLPATPVRMIPRAHTLLRPPGPAPMSGLLPLKPLLPHEMPPNKLTLLILLLTPRLRLRLRAKIRFTGKVNPGCHIFGGKRDWYLGAGKT